VPSVFSCTQREEVQARPFREKGYIYEITSESSKTYQIYILGQRQIETSRDISFEEEMVCQRSKEYQMEINSETMPSPPSTGQRETYIIPDYPVAPVDMPRDIVVGHKRLA
jgi:hypothetical protein